MTLRSVLALAALALLSGCASDFQFDEMEVQIRWVAPGTAAGVLVVEKGLRGDETKATEALRSILQGRRRFPPDGGFISLDVDDAETKAAEDPNLGDDDRTLLELGRELRVEKTGLFEDERGRLCVYQFWTIEHPSRLLAWANGEESKSWIAHGATGDPASPTFPYLDEESRTRALARARAGGSWLRLEDGDFVFDLPITRACAARCVAEIVEKDDVRKNYGPFLTQAASLEISEERTLLRYRPAASGWFGPWSETLETETHGEDRLHAWIKAGALPIGAPPGLLELEGILRVRESLKNPPK